MTDELPSKEIRGLAEYIRGMADAMQNTRLSKAAEWLDQLSDYVCAGGFIGCGNGDKCTSDHK